jgi:DNA-binding NarL/FixJ family response regulator
MVADDHTILRQGLAAVLAEEPDFEFVGFAEDGQQTLERYAALKPDVVLLDLRMPKRDGLQVARELVNGWQAKVLILTAFDHDEDLRQSLKAGAKGYLLKDAAREEIAAAVRTVAQGGTYLPARLAHKLAGVMFRTEHRPILLPRVRPSNLNTQLLTISPWTAHPQYCRFAEMALRRQLDTFFWRILTMFSCVPFSRFDVCDG